MIPSFVLVSWRRDQRFPVPIPVLLLWPVVLPLWFAGWVLTAIARVKTSWIAKLHLACSAFGRLSGLRVAIQSDDTYLTIAVI